jgi:hypothetical protein
MFLIFHHLLKSFLALHLTTIGSRCLVVHAGLTFGPIMSRNLNFVQKGVSSLAIAPTTRCVYISRDVVFDENVFPFDELHENAGAQLPVDILLLPPSLRNFHGHDIVDDLRAYSANPGSEVDGVQVENIIAEARTQQGATGVENSIAEAMDLAGALDPQAQSTSNHTSADGQASSSDRRPDLASSAHARAATPGSVPGLDPSAATSASAPDSPMATSPSDTR